MKMKTKMKFLFISLVALSLLPAFNSCKNDDDDSDSLVGTWYYRDVAAGEIKTNSAANDAIIKSYVAREGVDEYIGFWYEFSTNGTFRSSYKDEKPLTATYTYANGFLTFITEGERDKETMKVSVASDVMTFEKDYTNRCSNLSQSELRDLGVNDPGSFRVTKAIGKINFLKR